MRPVREPQRRQMVLTGDQVIGSEASGSLPCAPWTQGSQYHSELSAILSSHLSEIPKSRYRYSISFQLLCAHLESFLQPALLISSHNRV